MKGKNSVNKLAQHQTPGLHVGQRYEGRVTEREPEIADTATECGRKGEKKGKNTT